MNDDLIRSYMTAAGMLMEDVSAKVVIDPLAPERVGDLRRLVNELTTIADVVDAVRRSDG
ncbi:hypothetical protein KZ813_19280 [Sphingomonas sp. RHCKR7]|uniref:hypothetical protein n=1 Tax=Sphingomonas folli TaxID=2862497 RepID=UPI001CA4B581|nr:hypothetical protein [Sphingomonas folli]MBW6528987.1 hypothetical protein [Sphingomonas folli]